MEFNELLNKITLGDSYKIIKDIPDKSIDCVYIDIPYLFQQGGTGNSKIAKQVQKMKMELKTLNIYDGIDYSILKDIIRIMKNINCFIWCSKEQILDIMNYFKNNCDCTYQILVWCKTNPVPMCNGNWLSDIEYCLYFNRGTGMLLKNK